MSLNILQKSMASLLLLATSFLSLSAFADGGIVLGGTRLIYPAGQKQISLSIRNTSQESGFLVQSWVEDATGKKSNDFIVTPPLFVSNPGDENILRLMYTGPTLPTNRESLFYFNAKAVPSIDKTKIKDSNTLILATVTRIKLFYRPSGLQGDANDAPSMLTFSRSGEQVKINNPTPYHVTMVKVYSGKKKLEDIMVPPFGSADISLPKGSSPVLTYSTVNDYGAFSQKKSIEIN